MRTVYRPPPTAASLAGDHTFAVRSKDAAGNVDSTPAESAWTIDLAPVVTVDGPADPTNSTSASLSFSSNEVGVSYECSLDDSGYGSCISPALYTGLATGSHVFRVRAVDGLGAGEPAVHSWTISPAPETTIDAVEPAIPAPDFQTESTSATFTFSANQAGVTYECSLDEVAPQPCTSPQEFSGLLPGDHDFEVTAIGAGGARDLTPATFSWEIGDLTAPVVTITGGPTTASGGETEATSATFTFTVDEADPTDMVLFCSIDGSVPSATGCASGKTYSEADIRAANDGELAGPHTFEVYAEKPNLLAPIAVAAWEWTIVDLTAPAAPTIVSGPLAEIPLGTPASFVFSSNEADAVFECSVDGAAYEECAAPPDNTAELSLDAGVHTLLVRAVDPSLNAGPASEPYTWMVVGEPTTTISANVPAAPDTTESSSATFTLSVAPEHAPATFSCFLDGIVVPDCSSPRILTGLAEGEHVLEVEATNRYGMVEATPATYTWIVAVAPVVTIESGPVATTLQTEASIVFSGTDNTTPAESLTFECSTNGTDWAACTSPYELTGLTPGDYTAYVRAIDGFGNVGAPDSHSWTVEAPPAPNTAAGSNVSVVLDLPAGQTATVTYANVTTAGNTTADAVPGGSPLPAGYLAGGASYYDISTNAVYSAPITVCLTYVPGSLVEPARLLHWDSAAGTWVDITTSGDPAAGKVCGVADSLSPFAIATGTTLVVPETTIASGPEATTASATATFFFTTGEPNDPTATYECSVDGGLTWSVCESPHVLEGLVPGNYELQVVATSTSGIVDTTPASHSWTVVAPDTTIVSGPAASTRSTVAEFRFSSTDPEATFECSLDSGTWGSCESNYLIEDIALGAHELQVRARSDAGTLDADPAVHEWTVVAPNTMIDSGPEQPTWALDGTFTFSSDEPTATFECSLDGELYEDCLSPYSASVPVPGVYTLSVRAVNIAGGVDPTPATRQWTVTSYPDTILDVTPPNPSDDSTATFEFSSDQEGVTFECALDDAVDDQVWVPCTSPKEYTGMIYGEHAFAVRAIDALGHIDPEPAEYEWEVGIIAPTVELTSKPAARTDSTSATFEFSAVGRNLTYECSLDAGEWTPCASPKSYNGLLLAPHTFEVRVLVPEDHPEAPITLHSWTITELDPPETTIVLGPNPAVPSISTSATFAIQSDEPVSTFECSLDNADFAPCPDPAVYTGLADGTHTFKARATDAAGNVDETPASWTWTVAADRTAPTTTLLDHPDAETTLVDAGFTFVSNEPGSTFECALDAESLASCESPIAYTDLALGEHTFRIRATDVHGNVEALQSFTWNVILDTVPPETTLQGRPADPTYDTIANFSFVASELDATFECSLDGEPFAECESPMEYSDLTVAEHTFEVRAVDLAGNPDQSAESYSWTVEAIPDTEAPDTRILTQPADPSPSTIANFTFASEAGATFECSLDGEPFAECESPEEYEVEPGDHTFEVRATDLALNTDDTPARYEWNVLAPPDTSLVTFPADPSNSTSATFEFASDQTGVEYVCEIDGLGTSLCASPKTFSGLADGEHTLTVAARNATYGLVDETPVEFTWTVAVPPNTTILEKPLSSTTATSATFTFNANEIDSAFECALDGAAFADCESPASYSALSPGPHTFQVRAIDGAGNVDPSADSYSWTITDGIAPETAISQKPSDPSTLSSATFAFAGTDNLDALGDLRYECRFDGDGEFSACTSPRTYSGLAEGAPYSFEVRAVDRAGNPDPTPAVWTWRVVPPDCSPVQTVGATADSWIEQKSGASNHGADSVLKVTSKSGENTRALVRFPSPTVPSGCVLQSATLRLYAGGYTGGRTIQALPLAADWTEGGVNWNNQPATTGTASATDSGQGHRTWDVTAHAAASASNFGFLIRDAVEGNGGSEQQLHSREKSDNQPQMVYRFASAADSAVSCGAQLTVGANADAWVDQAAPIANKGSDATLKVLSKGPAHNARGLVRFDLPALPAGCAVQSATMRLHLNALATDRILEAWRVAGSWSEGGVVWDNQPATAGEAVTTMSGLGPGATAGWREWNVSAQVVSMYASTNNGFLIRDAGDNNGGAEQQFASREASMNRPELVIRFAAPDTRPPTTTIDNGPSGTVPSTTANFAFSSNESAATFECSLDDLAYTACVSPKTYSNLSVGSHTLNVRAKDAAGNIDGTPASRSWTVELAPDLAPPDTGILTKPNNPSPTHSPSFTFTGTDDSTPASQLSYECKLDLGVFAPCASPKSYANLSHGSHTFQVRATDLAGRQDPSAASYTWMVDLNPPQTTINNGPSGTTTSTTETVQFSADDAAATFECRLDAGPWTACTSPRHLTGITAGPHTFRVRAIDAAGNADPSEAIASWTANVSSCTAGSITVTSVADSWVLQSDAAKNNGGDSVLKLDSKSGSNARALVRFNLPTLPAGCDVVSAKLRLYASSYKDGRTLQAIPLAAAWTENLVTWGNQPATSGTAATTTSGFGYREWTVTTRIQAMYAPGGVNHGFLIRDATENAGGMDQAFHSREKLTDNPPQLVVQYD